MFPIKRTLQTIGGLFLCQAVIAGSTNPSITKIVYRITSPQIAPNSFASQPKTLYIGGETYARSEESPDPEQGIHGLIITSEPDAWMINLLDHSGQHYVDSGPTFVVHHCIAERRPVKECLEYGKEMVYFRAHNAASLGTRELEKQHCEGYELKLESRRFVLYTSVEKQTPVRLEIYEDGILDFAVRYMSYETGMPFDAKLFKPPTGIKISEPRH